MPRVNLTSGQDDLGVGVGFDQFFGKGTGRPVADSLAITEKLIPFLASKLPHAVVFGEEGIVPHQTIGRVLNTGGHHMVAFQVSESLESLAEGYFRSVSPIASTVIVSRDIQAVPVRPTPRARTFIGTLRWHFRLSMQVSPVKTSVHGWGARLSE